MQTRSVSLGVRSTRERLVPVAAAISSVILGTRRAEQGCHPGSHYERSRGKVQVDLQELRFAMEEATFEHVYFLDTETGEVILVSEMFDDEEAQRQLAEIDAAEPDPYLQVPHVDSRQGYDDMRDFVDTVSDEPLEELLRVAIQGRGAFRRFNDRLVRHPAERQRWSDLQAERLFRTCPQVAG